MFQILRTAEFDAWISGLRDKVGQGSGASCPPVAGHWDWGDCKPVGQEVTELRIDSGPGYRIHCRKDGATVIVALGGGDKSSQNKDIAKAQGMVQLLKA
ncbi:MAG: type II toxin-antitoxin system RelE/ParE family toxin [Polaromonas sp.]|jgi:putative addiction module killer protein|uniref:type II toxin-antitoxin system RelE/ParE family toxin n=1 Tax=Polaromonas sp. TaxID=1869339 RepID=UPI0027311D8B|nr:type II toxin-antitoxin system RelE/ParE family toxin [Polaromonas sp.]MDP2257327.1 type II toxin-antitoxin system RelE/ParE family toxin [Polaromonas sp.]